ncbi:MAG: PEP-utilizing protein mobile subunit, partial [Thermomicrobium sp.]|nr:PEP-utilizing protein mobile subunit [Thermomicrobium sp.]
MTRERFPYPWEVPTPPGAEGWEEMYPYYLLSRPETRDVERKLFWIADKIHNPYVCIPFDILPHEAWGVAIAQYTNRTFVIPGARGVDRRLINGYLYLGFVSVDDPQEIETRAALFQRRAGYYYEHWNQLYEQWKREVEGVIHEMEQLGFEPLPEYEAEEDVFSRKLGRSYQLYHAYRALVDRVFRLYQRHFEFLNIGYAAYLTFFTFCKQAFPEITDQTIARMVAGIDVILFRPDDELRKLATLAHQLGLSPLFLATPIDQLDQLLSSLPATPQGQQWLAAFQAAQYPWFYYSSGSGLYHDHLSWIDDLRLPLATIRDYVKQLTTGQSVERPLEQLRAERERIAQEYRALL